MPLSSLSRNKNKEVKEEEKKIEEKKIEDLVPKSGTNKSACRLASEEKEEEEEEDEEEEEKDKFDYHELSIINFLKSFSEFHKKLSDFNKQFELLSKDFKNFIHEVLYLDNIEEYEIKDK
jgi:hypothetical protein